MGENIRILVTGANGFVGTNLIKYLISDAVSNSVLSVRAMYQPKTPIEVLERFQKGCGKDKLDIVPGDLLDSASLNAACKGMNCIIHLAGLVSDWGPREKFFRVIADGTQNVLDAATANGVKRFIQMSSLTVHALSGHKFDDENAPKDMKNFAYGEAKIEAEKRVEAWGAAAEGRNYAIARPGFIIYGPYDVGSFINALDAIVKHQYMHVNKGKPLISYVYVENLAYGLHRLATAARVKGPYLVMDGNMPWLDFVDAWCKVAGKKPIRASVPYGLVAPVVWLMQSFGRLIGMKKSPVLNMYRIGIPRRDLAFNNTKMKTEIGYEPAVSFDEGLVRTYQYYQEIHSSK